MTETIPKNLLAYIATHIDSIELLDVLVLLHTKPDQQWSAEDLDQHIRSSLSSITNRLEYLVDLGLAVKVGDDQSRFQYSPSSEELRYLSDELVRLYQTRRILITEVIYTKSLKEMVSFSRAFRIRKEQKDG